MTADRETVQEAAPLVTVVMPAYNHARYVVEAIESIRAQTIADWSLEVIDDGSTDDTWRVLSEYAAAVADRRIRIRRQSNAGSHATLNAGLRGARSRWLSILNSDDRYAPDRLERLVAAGEAAGGDAFVATGVRLIDAAGEPVDAGHWWRRMYDDNVRRWEALRSHPDNPDVQALLWGNFTVSTSNFFMSRGVWERTGTFRHLRYVPDWDYALRVAASNPRAFLFLPQERTLDYRLHGGNTILGGALRNHVEASHVLREFQKRWVRDGHRLGADAIDRLHYLVRFERHEHARQALERSQVGWQEQVQAERALREHERERWDADREHWRAERAQWEALRDAWNEERARWDAERERVAAERDRWDAERAQWEGVVRAMRESTSWRVTRPLRWAGAAARGTVGALRTRAAGLHRVAAAALPPARPSSAYRKWLEAEAAGIAALRERAGEIVSSLPSTPLVSVVMPVHDTSPEFLRAAVRSVQSQWYPEWELCICDDASGRDDTRAALADLERSDARIRVVRREVGGHVAVATNDAIAIARGEFVAFLDHDDELAPHALLRLVQEAGARPDVDLVYTDEDKIDSAGERSLPFFKPDWSPVLEWAQNYVGHLVFVRRALLLQAGALRAGTQGSQDHDLVLRLAQAGARIAHLPEVLYHWRMHAGSTASNSAAKPYAHDAGRAAVANHLAARYGERFERVEDGEWLFTYRPRFAVPAGTLASIVIPTRDHARMLADCIDSIRDVTVGAQWEIVLLDNGSREPETKALFESLRRDARVRVVDADMPFNWSRLNNLGRRHASGHVLVFLNNDTVVISPDWLRRIAEYALLPDVGTVGPMLLYPDGTIQHAGVVVGMGGWADHVFKGAAVTHFPSPFVSSVLPRNVLANTGACVAIETAKFDRLGGFDEAFQICGSDVELGIRAHRAGLQNVYLPDVRLYHLESKTRTPDVPTVDFEQSARCYAPFRTEGDPFFNPNLDADSPAPVPRFPARPTRLSA